MKDQRKLNKDALANPKAIVQHCQPAYRGQEITEDNFEAHTDEMFEEVKKQTSYTKGRNG